MRTSHGVKSFCNWVLSLLTVWSLSSFYLAAARAFEPPLPPTNSTPQRPKAITNTFSATALFVETNVTEKVTPQLLETNFIRYRFVALNPSAFASPTGRFLLNLFEDVNVTAEVERFEGSGLAGI